MLDYNNIYNTYSPKLKVLFNKQMRDKDYVEDLVQDTLLKVWQALPTYDDKYQLSTWIYTIAFNTLKNYYKSTKDVITYAPTLYDNEHTEDLNSPEEILIAAETEDNFNSAVNSMESNFLEVYTMKEVDGMSYQSISTQLDIPIGTVKSRLKRARDHIKKELS